MKRTGTPLVAAALALSAVTFAPSPALAADCSIGHNQPGQQPVPALYVALCHDSTLNPNPGALPSVRIVPNVGDPTIFAIYVDIPADVDAEGLRVRYAVDGEGNEIPIPLGVSGPRSICVFYTGPGSLNPGGCLLAVHRG